MLSKLINLEKKSVLDVACGGCSLERNLLVKLFDEVNMFDQCKRSVKLARILK